jgi:hypothetical protein
MTSSGFIYLGLVALALTLHVFRRKSLERYQHWVALYLALTIIFLLLSVIVVEIAGAQNNLFLFHVYNPLEYITFCFLYLDVTESIPIRKAIRVSMVTLIVISIFFAFSIQPLTQNNSYTILLESILMIVWSVLFLRETILLQREDRLQQYPMFWISVGLLFYFIGNLLTETLLGYLGAQSIDLSRKAYKLSFIFKFMLAILFIISVYSRKFFNRSVRHKRNLL